MQVFYLLYVIVNCHLLAIHSILMRFVEVSLLSQLFPSALSLLCNHFGFLQLQPHFLHLLLESLVLVLDVSYQSNLIVMEGSLLLELMPLLLENI